MKPILAFILMVVLAGVDHNAGAEEQSFPVAPEPQMIDSGQIINLLKKGGYVLYFRHALTDDSQKDTNHTDLSDCKEQRNLSEAGRTQAKNIGEAIKKLKIPFAEVIASPYCRCVDTATLAFGKAEKQDYLQFPPNATKEERQNRIQKLNHFLGSLPPQGKNNIVVSHTGNMKDAVGIWPEPEGAAYIFEPLGENKHGYIGAVKPNEWGN